MKKVTLTIASQRPDGISVKDYQAAKKQGDLVVNGVTALENVRLSKGLYEVKPERSVVEFEVKASKPPEEMDKAELVAEMTAYGKPPRKQMDRSKAVEFVHKLRADAAELITDDDLQE